jgi:tRNA threonylcarbamoyl adenosine modification protein (Sua5/YciO/YrdC/YwlC family)
MIEEINIHNPQPRKIAKIVDILKNGGIIAFPTDTFYAIGCDIMNRKAIEKIYQLKQRDKKQPFSFICSDLKNISEYAKVSNQSYRIIRRLVPGPYTFILEATKLVPKIMLNKRKEAGIRVPDHVICNTIVSGLVNPVISTTASTPEGEYLDSPFAIEEFFKNRIDVIIDGGSVPAGPSTVLSLSDAGIEVIREGLGSIEGILEA